MGNTSWDEAYERYIKLIVFAAHKEFNAASRYYSDNAVTPDDLVQIGLIKLMDCLEKYPSLEEEEFKAVFQTTLFRAIKRALKMSVITDDLEKSVNLALDEDDDPVVSGIHYEEALARLLAQVRSPISIAVLQEIIEPSPRTVWESWADRTRKKMVKSQGKSGNLAKTDEIRLKHIRLSLGITQKQLDLALGEIREKAREVFDLVEN